MIPKRPIGANEKVADPTPEEIADRSLECQAKWSWSDRCARLDYSMRDPKEPAIREYATTIR